MHKKEVNPVLLLENKFKPYKIRSHEGDIISIATPRGESPFSLIPVQSQPPKSLILKSKSKFKRFGKRKKGVLMRSQKNM